MAAETLYRERKLSVAAIAQRLHITKSTLYSYLRHRGVEIGPYRKPSQTRSDTSTTVVENGQPKIAIIRLSLRVENNSKFVRGKKRALADIERYCLARYDSKKLPRGDYALKVPFGSEQELDKLMLELLTEIAMEADSRNCFTECNARLEGSDRHW
jgi:hypothetical protein